MRAAVIENGVVTNIIVVETLDVFPGLVEAGNAAIGDHYVDGAIVPPPPTPAPVPEFIDPLQGLLIIDEYGYSEEFDAWAKSPERTFVERAFFDKAKTWRRDDATVIAAGTALGLSSSDLDNLFREAATK